MTVKTTIHPKELFEKVKNDRRMPHFNKIVPLYDDKWELIDKKDDWYMSNIEARWTKREVYDKDDEYPMWWEFTLEDWIRKGIMSFDTARSPPIEYYQALYNKMLEKDENADLACTYMEWWMWFFGERINGLDDERNFDNVHYIHWIEWYIITNEEDYDLFVHIHWEDGVYKPEEIRDEFNKNELDKETIEEIEEIIKPFIW